MKIVSIPFATMKQIANITPTNNISQDLQLYCEMLEYNLDKIEFSELRRRRFYLSKDKSIIILEEDNCKGKQLNQYLEVLVNSDLDYMQMRSNFLNFGMQRNEEHEICSPFADVFNYYKLEIHIINVDEILDQIHEYYYPEGNTNCESKLDEILNKIHVERNGTGLLDDL